MNDANPLPHPDTAARELALRHFALIDAGEPADMAALFEPDAVYTRPGFGPFLGREGILRFYTRLRPIREGAHSLETVIASGGQVAVRGGFTGVLHSGAPIELRFSDFFTVGATGLFSRRETFFAAPLT